MSDKNNSKSNDRDSYVNRLESAAKTILREALDNVEVHPCDYNDDAIRANGLSKEMRALYDIILEGGEPAAVKKVDIAVALASFAASTFPSGAASSDFNQFD